MIDNDVKDSVKDVEKDLIFEMSEDTQALIDNKIIDTHLLNVRDIVNDFDPTKVSKLQEYGDGLLYRAYYVAKNHRTGSKGIIARELGISNKLMDYYLYKYPKLGLAIQMGISDARDEMKETIVNSLYKSATGQIVSDVAEVTEDIIVDGEIVSTKRKTAVSKKFIPPNVAAGIELMKRLDPAWVPQVDVNINGEVDHNYNVVKDVNVAVDYSRLSTSALKELISSVKNTDVSTDPKKTYYIPEKSEYIAKEVEQNYLERKKAEQEGTKRKYTKRNKVSKILEKDKAVVEKTKNSCKKEVEKLSKNKKETPKNGKGKQSKANDGSRKRTVSKKSKD